MHLSRVWSSQILCLVSGGMCGWNIIVLQSRVCLYVRYWCHLHTGGKFDCPRCLELFRLPCLNTTPTKSGTYTWPCSRCVYGPFTTQLPPKKEEEKNGSCPLQTQSLLLHFFLLVSLHDREHVLRENLTVPFSHCPLPCENNIPVTG